MQHRANGLQSLKSLLSGPLHNSLPIPARDDKEQGHEDDVQEHKYIITKSAQIL